MVARGLGRATPKDREPRCKAAVGRNAARRNVAGRNVAGKNVEQRAAWRSGETSRTAPVFFRPGKRERQGLRRGTYNPREAADCTCPPRRKP